MDLAERILSNNFTGLVEGLSFTDNTFLSCMSIEDCVVEFRNCDFLGTTSFYSLVLNKEFKLVNCRFEDLGILSCYFKDNLLIQNCTVRGEFSIINSSFKNEVNLINNTYQKGLNLFKEMGDNFGIVAFEGGLFIK